MIKTKEMMIDFRTKDNEHEPIVIKNVSISRTDIYKYLGILIDDHLNWHEQCSNIISRNNQRLYFIRKLQEFYIDTTIISLFYNSAMESILCFCLIAYGGNITIKDENKIDSIIKKVQKVTNVPLHTIKELYSMLVKKKINQINKKSDHPMKKEIRYSERENSNLVLYPKIRTERYRRSFIPSALRSLNNEL